jgi:hypothetical protein
MSIDKIKHTATITHPNIVIYGEGGRGKSTLGASFPNPIFLDTDHSIDAFEVSKTPKLLGWEATNPENTHLGLKYWLDWLATEKHDFKTVVLDTLDSAEYYFKQLIVKEYKAEHLNDDKIKALNFGKGSEILGDRIWNDLLAKLDILSKKKGMYVVVLVHQGKQTVKLPHGEDYQRTAPLLEKHTVQALGHWADIIGLLDVRQSVTENNKVVTSKESYVFTEKKEAYVAKQREGYHIPEVLDARKFAEEVTKLIK